MKFSTSIAVVSCLLLQVCGYPYYPYYGSNMESLSFGATDSSRGGMVMNRYYNPYISPRGLGGGMAAFMFRPSDQAQPPQQYYRPDRRRQTLPDVNLIPPQQNEVYLPPPERQPLPSTTFATEIADPTERTEVSTTLKTISPELTEEVDDVEPVKPKKRVSKKKQVKKPVEEEEDEQDDTMPKMPGGTFFPMFFGWGGRSAGGGTPGGATAVANAYSTGRGGVATSHATAYGPPRPDFKYQA